MKKRSARFAPSMLGLLAVTAYACDTSDARTSEPDRDASVLDSTASADGASRAEATASPMDALEAPGALGADTSVAPSSPPDAAAVVELDGARAAPVAPADGALKDALAYDRSRAEQSEAAAPAGDAGGDASAPPCQGDCACAACLGRACADHAKVGDLQRHCRNLPGIARAGARTGAPLASLCLELVECARETRCAAHELESCMCGRADTESCLENFELANGPCLSQTIAAAQTDNLADLLLGYLDPTYALGSANLLVRCEAQHCARECHGAQDGGSQMR